MLSSLIYCFWNSWDICPSQPWHISQALLSLSEYTKKLWVHCCRFLGSSMHIHPFPEACVHLKGWVLHHLPSFSSFPLKSKFWMFLFIFKYISTLCYETGNIRGKWELLQLYGGKNVKRYITQKLFYLPMLNLTLQHWLILQRMESFFESYFSYVLL